MQNSLLHVVKKPKAKLDEARIKVLKMFEQEHLITAYDSLEENEKNSFVRQIDTLELDVIDLVSFDLPTSLTEVRKF